MIRCSCENKKRIRVSMHGGACRTAISAAGRVGACGAENPPGTEMRQRAALTEGAGAPRRCGIPRRHTRQARLGRRGGCRYRGPSWWRASTHIDQLRT